MNTSAANYNWDLLVSSLEMWVCMSEMLGCISCCVENIVDWLVSNQAMKGSNSVTKANIESSPLVCAEDSTVNNSAKSVNNWETSANIADFPQQTKEKWASSSAMLVNISETMMNNSVKLANIADWMGNNLEKWNCNLAKLVYNVVMKENN